MTSPGSRPAELAPCCFTYGMTKLGTVTGSFRWPAWITTSAVMTFVMLAIGRLMFSARLHSCRRVTAFTRSAPRACTPAGPAAAAAGRSGAAAAAVAGGAEAPTDEIKNAAAIAAAAELAVSMRGGRTGDSWGHRGASL